ncbi:lanthionine synthetase C family protein [Pseudofrankia sp. BMG5.37]|uniref:lanthionine synthetase C family protein n=1 Tax=Pseudofrankia sp. BMG5.37 TaxID=3050035 RepID=UPI002893D7C6|nr:lanthionine synthetase C family protein [Pseudofrankia sp. BMG5.37]MDT3444483.1 lanthionine synthetase C family protein [Pseudofrankia sp. BMG5.37]
MPTPTTTAPDLASHAEQLAAQLSIPEPPPADAPWTPQSLTNGDAGIALLHIERAHTGHGTWQQAHQWVSAATAGAVSAADTAGLYLGAPAIAFLLDAAAAGTGRYRDALADVDRPVAALAHRRVDAATARLRAGQLPTFREYDVFFGLAGLGALLLRRDPGGSTLERVLTHLVALTRPLRNGDQRLPGWWVGHDPHRRHSPTYPGGHANLGLAHGISPLALLAQAMRRGIVVDGHHDAIITICQWLDTWQQDSDTGPWWPEWISRADLRQGRPGQRGPARPSWCYGTVGIARAGQLAALAIADTARQRLYEDALARCLDDPAQQNQIVDAGLCHGAAGVYQTVWRAARDAKTPALAGHLPRLAHRLTTLACRQPASRPGLLTGAAGTALALHTAAHDTPPISGWDTCLLIN